MKFRDYYDIYSILKEGYSIHVGIDKARKYSHFHLTTKNLVTMLLAGQFAPDDNFLTLEAKYNVGREEIRSYILQKLKG